MISLEKITRFSLLCTLFIVGCLFDYSNRKFPSERNHDYDGNEQKQFERDCDDNNPNAYTGATEGFDRTDNNCNEETDEADSMGTVLWYADGDSDKQA